MSSSSYYDEDTFKGEPLMEKTYLFEKPLDKKIKDKKLLILLIIIIVLFFPLILILGAFLPLFKK